MSNSKPVVAQIDEFARTTQDKKRRNGVYWGTHADKGILRVSKFFARHFLELGLDFEEYAWVLAVLSYQYHPDEPPYPDHETIGRHMGISERTSRRRADSLVAKGLLRKEDRGRKQDGTLKSRGMDFSLLFKKVDALARGATGETEEEAPTKQTTTISTYLGVEECDRREMTREEKAAHMLGLRCLGAGYNQRLSDEDALAFTTEMYQQYPDIDLRSEIGNWVKARQGTKHDGDALVDLRKFITNRAKYRKSA